MNSIQKLPWMNSADSVVALRIKTCEHRDRFKLSEGSIMDFSRNGLMMEMILGIAHPPFPFDSLKPLANQAINQVNFP